VVLTDKDEATNKTVTEKKAMCSRSKLLQKSLENGPAREPPSRRPCFWESPC
jgi:hypothetical protein